MQWSPKSISQATGGTLSAPPGPAGQLDAATLGGVGIDTRRLRAGDLFVAIRGERDGHDFLGAAVAAGAGAVLVDQPDRLQTGAGVPAIVVADTAQALLDVGAAARDRLSGPVVAITGSVGKTSTKDLTAAAVAARFATAASERSFNNELGVPLTLANAPESTEVTVLEMGSRGPGHIARLCGFARPTIGVVTAVAAAHTEAFGGLEGVAAAKGELVEALPADGTAVLNADDPRVLAMAVRTDAEVISYSWATPPNPVAQVAAEGISLDDDLRPTFRVRSPWGSTEVRLEARGVHQVGNALAALAVAGRCGVDLDAAAAALSTARLSPWRMDVARSRSGATILNDAYNANPASVAAALDALVGLRAGRRVAVLGVMAELGEEGDSEHLAVAEQAARQGVELMAFGTDRYGIAPLEDFDEVIKVLGELGAGDAVLVKASRVAGLERLAARLLDT